MDQLSYGGGYSVKSQSNHDTLVATILRKKSYNLTISYNFWLNDKT